MRPTSSRSNGCQLKEILAAALFALLAAPASYTQNAPIRFEVASVKPADPHIPIRMESPGGPGTSRPGEIRYQRVTLLFLLTMAYDVHFDQISAPSWTGDEQYSVDAKLPPGTTIQQVHSMLRNLIAERFGLRLHHQFREFPVYENGSG